MIKEAYVSFEVSKLLKEKGFDIPIDCKNWLCCMYDKNENVHWGIYDKNWYLRITHQMAMQWLREVHNIMISPYALSLGYYFEILDLTTRDITGCKPLYQVGVPSKECVLNTYEDAVETALKYCLENVI